MRRKGHLIGVAFRQRISLRRRHRDRRPLFLAVEHEAFRRKRDPLRGQRLRFDGVGPFRRAGVISLAGGRDRVRAGVPAAGGPGQRVGAVLLQDSPLQGRHGHLRLLYAAVVAEAFRGQRHPVGRQRLLFDFVCFFHFSGVVALAGDGEGIRAGRLALGSVRDRVGELFRDGIPRGVLHRHGGQLHAAVIDDAVGQRHTGGVQRLLFDLIGLFHRSRIVALARHGDGIDAGQLARPGDGQRVGGALRQRIAGRVLHRHVRALLRAAEDVSVCGKRHAGFVQRLRGDGERQLTGAVVLTGQQHRHAVIARVFAAGGIGDEIVHALLQPIAGGVAHRDVGMAHLPVEHEGGLRKRDSFHLRDGFRLFLFADRAGKGDLAVLRQRGLSDDSSLVPAVADNVAFKILGLFVTADRADAGLQAHGHAGGRNLGRPLAEAVLAVLRGKLFDIQDIAAHRAARYREAVGVPGGRKHRLERAGGALMLLHHGDLVFVDVAVAVLDVQGAALRRGGRDLDGALAGERQHAVLIHGGLIVRTGQQEAAVGGAVGRDFGPCFGGTVFDHVGRERSGAGGVAGFEFLRGALRGDDLPLGLFIIERVVESRHHGEDAAGGLFQELRKGQLEDMGKIPVPAEHVGVIDPAVRQVVTPRDPGGVGRIVVPQDHAVQHPAHRDGGDHRTQGIPGDEIPDLLIARPHVVGKRLDLFRHPDDIVRVRRIEEPDEIVSVKELQDLLHAGGEQPDAAEKLFTGAGVAFCVQRRERVQQLPHGAAIDPVDRPEGFADLFHHGARQGGGLDHQRRGVKPAGDRLGEHLQTVDELGQLAHMIFDDLGFVQDLDAQLDDELVSRLEPRAVLLSADVHVRPFRFDGAVGVVDHMRLLHAGDQAGHVVQRDIGDVGQRDLHRVILVIERDARELEIQMQGVARPHVDAAVHREGVVDLLLERHDGAGEGRLHVVVPGGIAAHVPVGGAALPFRHGADVLLQVLRAVYHRCQRQPLRQHQLRRQIFQRVRLGIVDDQHLHVEHFLLPVHLAVDDQIEVFPDGDHDQIQIRYRDGGRRRRRGRRRNDHLRTFIDPVAVDRGDITAGLRVALDIHGGDLLRVSLIGVPSVELIEDVDARRPVGQLDGIAHLHIFILAPGVVKLVFIDVIVQMICGVGVRDRCRCRPIDIESVDEIAQPVVIGGDGGEFQLQVVFVDLLVFGGAGIDARGLDLLLGHQVRGQLHVVGVQVAEADGVDRVDAGGDGNRQVTGLAALRVGGDRLFAHRQDHADAAVFIGVERILAVVFRGDIEMGVGDGLLGLGVDDREVRAAVIGVLGDIDLEPLDRRCLHGMAAGAGMLLFALRQHGGRFGDLPFAELVPQLFNGDGIRTLADRAGPVLAAVFGTGGFGGDRPFAVAVARRFDHVGLVVVAAGTVAALQPVDGAADLGHGDERAHIVPQRIKHLDIGIAADGAGQDLRAAFGTGGLRLHFGDVGVLVIVQQEVTVSGAFRRLLRRGIGITVDGQLAAAVEAGGRNGGHLAGDGDGL